MSSDVSKSQVSVNCPQIARLVTELAEQLQSGVPVDLETLCTKHPEHREQLEILLPTLEAVVDLEQSLAAGELADHTRTTVPLGGVLGDFRIVREIGRGGMGIVYEAEQLSLNRQVALKVLPFAAILDERQLKRFKNEAQVAATLKHPHIVSVYGVGCERAVHYIAMELIEGHSLAGLIEAVRNANRSIRDRFASPVAERDPVHVENGDLDSSKPILNQAETEAAAALTTEYHGDRSQFFRSAVNVVIPVAHALHFAHTEGVIHRDVKPSNLLIDQKGQPWVTDFGLARLQSGDDLTVTGDLMGTLRYMSPEQAAGKKLLDQRTDIYSLGMTLFELLTLQSVFQERDRQKLLRQVIEQEAPSPRSIDRTIPKDLETIVLKAIAKDPDSRYASALDLADDLRRFVDQKPIHARRVKRWERTWRWTRRNPSVASLIATVAFLLVFIAAASGVVAWKHASDARELRQRLYVSDISNAYQAWEQGNLARVRQLVSRQVPRQGEVDLRGFEWHHLRAQYQRVLLAPQFDHGGAVRTLAFSPDRTVLATGGDGGVVKLWDLRVGGRELTTVLAKHGERVNTVAFSPDGKLLAVGSYEHPVAVWDVSTGKQVAELSRGVGTNFSVSFSPNGAWLAAAGCPKQRGPHEIRIWRTLDWREYLVLASHTGEINSIAFSVDSNLIASASSDHTVKLWNVETGNLCKELVHDHEVFAVAFSPDGQMLASGGFNYEARIWDADTWNIRTTLRETGHSVSSLDFSPNSKMLVSAGRDRTARLWNASTGKLLTTLKGHIGDLAAVGYSPDGNIIATGGLDGAARLWDVTTVCQQQPADVRGQWKTTVTFSPNGHNLTAATALFRREAGDEAGQLRLWQLSGGRRAIDSPDSYFMCATFSPDGDVLATGGKRISTQQGQISFWKPEDLTEVDSINVGRREVYSLSFSPTGETLVSGDMDGAVILWDVASRQIRRELLKSSDEGVTCVRFSPDGAFLAAATGRRRPIHNDWNDCIVRIWDVKTGELTATLVGHTELVMSLEFSPDGSTLASSGTDDMIKLWNVAARNELRTLVGHSLYVLSVAFSPDGKTLASASADSTVRLWNVATGDELCILKRPVTATSVAFCPDGTTLAVGHSDKSVQLWHSTLSKPNWPVSLH